MRAKVHVFLKPGVLDVQGKAVEGIGYQVEELGWLKELKKAKLDPSLREVSRPLNIHRAGGVASIGEGEYEALPSSPDAEEITGTSGARSGTNRRASPVVASQSRIRVSIPFGPTQRANSSPSSIPNATRCSRRRKCRA